MPRRTLVRLEDVADLGTLAAAYWRAKQGRRLCPTPKLWGRRGSSGGFRPAPRPSERGLAVFERNPMRELSTLAQEILELSVPVGSLRSFRIHDPKPRTIHAPCFRERVLHHALMEHVGPVLERSLVDATFACRDGKGTLAAVHRAQDLARCSRYVAKLDARTYFASIDHEVLIGQLRRRIKGRRVLELLQRIVTSHEGAPGVGLPIGALTSQHFANLYLGVVDRLILEHHRLGLVRYMDDLLVFGNDRGAMKKALAAAETLGREMLRLTLTQKQAPTPCHRGFPFCGFRVLPHRLRLLPRGKRRYRQGRRLWEEAFGLGLIDARGLQAGYAAAQTVTAQAAATAFRRNDLRRRPAPDA